MSHTPDALTRIAAALERMSPPEAPLDLSGAARFVWRSHARTLAPVPDWRGPDLTLLRGVADQAERLNAALRAFAAGAQANHALLWGARGTGKSALAKAVFAAALESHPDLKLIDLPAIAVADAPALLEGLAVAQARAVVLIDDLSLDAGEAALRGLKPALDGGLMAGGGAVMVIATTNRRHIVAQAPERGDGGFDPARADAEHERLALSDRFGLWLGFHPIDQDAYLAIVEAYALRFRLGQGHGLRAEALAWAMARGARSGRTAWQFILDCAARKHVTIAF